MGQLVKGIKPWTTPSASDGMRGGDRDSQNVRKQLDPAGQHGPWSDYWIAQCKDGKVRRIGAGVQPLAHGVPGRVGQLRAYGNAIVPLEAAIFIRAALDFIKESR